MKLDCFKALIENEFILMASHHGRKSGWGDAFMNWAKPCVSNISDCPNVGTIAISAYNEKSRSYLITRQDRKTATLMNNVTTNSYGDITIYLGKSKPLSFLVVFTIKEVA
jgi:hypothetical protein